MFKITINNDVDLYYQLNLSNNSNNKDEIQTIQSDESNTFDIQDYEKMIESMYNDDPIDNSIDDSNSDDNKYENNDNKNMNGYYIKKKK